MRQTLSGQCPPPGERPTPPVRAARRYETRSTRSIVSSRRRREASGSSRTSRSMSSGRLKAMAAGTVIRAPRARSSRLIPYWRPAVWSSGVRPTASVAFISAYGSISPAAPAGCLLITTKWRAPLVRAEGRSYWPVEAVDGQLVAGPERPQRSDGEVVREAACRRTGVIHVSRQRSRRRDQPFVPAQAVPMRPDPVAVVVVPRGGGVRARRTRQCRREAIAARTHPDPEWARAQSRRREFAGPRSCAEPIIDRRCPETTRPVPFPFPSAETAGAVSPAPIAGFRGFNCLKSQCTAW